MKKQPEHWNLKKWSKTMSKFRTTILTLTLIATVAFAGDPATWFDMENCGMCKHLLEDAELFEVTTWDNYILTNGMM